MRVRGAAAARWGLEGWVPDVDGRQHPVRGVDHVTLALPDSRLVYVVNGESRMPAKAWTHLQQLVDSCQECQRLGAGLIADAPTQPPRAPAPAGGELVFVSEAPPPTGGFWAPPPAVDDLREHLFEMLRAANVLLPDHKAPRCLEEFLCRGLFLLQAVKWPLHESARRLRPAERHLIDHSAESHLRSELCAIRPVVVVAMGKVALYACARILDGQSFGFDHRTQLREVQSRRFEVGLEGAQIVLYATGLPVKRQRRQFARITEDIGRAVSEQRLADAVRRLTAAYQPERIYLFGSHARGDAGPDSDYDLLVVVPDSAPLDQRGGRLAYAALRGTGTAADVLVQSKSYFESRLHLPASLPATVLREGRLLYAA